MSMYPCHDIPLYCPPLSWDNVTWYLQELHFCFFYTYLNFGAINHNSVNKMP